MKEKKKQMQYVSKCIKHCGKTTHHHSGQCVDCRTIVCKTCGEKDAWKTYARCICLKCFNKTKRAPITEYWAS